LTAVPRASRPGDSVWSRATSGHGVRTNLLRSGLSIVDQVVCSASSFVTLVILSRALLPADLGTYILVFNAVLMLTGLQQGFVTGPYRALGAPRGFAVGFVAAQARIQAALLACETLLLAAFLHWYLAVDGARLAASIGVLVLLQSHEFVRTVLATRLAVPRLLALDVVTHTLRLLGLFAMQRMGLLSVTTALGWLAASSLVAWFQMDRQWFAAVAIAEVWRANWRFGRWLLVESVAHLISTRSYLYVIGALLGREQVAALSASQNLANAVNVIVMGLTAAAVPIARLKLEREGYDAWKSWLTTVALLMLLASGGAFAAIAVFARPLVGWLYPSFYAPYAPLVIVLAFGMLLEALSANLTSAFWTAGRPELNVAGKVIAAAAAVVWAYPGVTAFGIFGAAAGLVLSPVIWLLVGGLFVLRGALSRARVLGPRESVVE
jgi:O-antigen/teichoic acid export membrane protein